MPNVSVVIPTYNSAHLLDDALQSVLEQTYKDFEIIVVDDGSTDNTAEVISKYDDKLRYFRVDNGGPAKARNYGISKSTGKYIAFLDADDKWLPTKLEKQMNMFEQNPEFGMVFTENSLFDARGIYKNSLGKDRLLKGNNLAQNIFLYSNIGTPTVMVRKDVFDAIGLFEESMVQAEDDNMWIRIAANYQVGFIDGSLVQVRDHSHRLTRTDKNLIEYVRNNITMLSSNYGDKVKKSIEKAVPRKLAKVEFDIGYSYFEKQEYKKARQAFIRSMSHSFYDFNILLYLIVAFAPDCLRRLVKFIKRKLFPSYRNKSTWIRYD
jgi:glycosyltransferase involved in cell wall biosynthesis